MVRKFPAARQQVKDIALSPRHEQQPETFDDLATILELEIILGRPREFRRRLHNAITSAYHHGISISKSSTRH